MFRGTLLNRPNANYVPIAFIGILFMGLNSHYFMKRHAAVVWSYSSEGYYVFTVRYGGGCDRL